MEWSGGEWSAGDKNADDSLIGGDAQIPRRLLGEGGAEGVVPKSGFPRRPGSSRVHIARLCRAGHEVAVVLQAAVEDRQAGGSVRRYVAQVCTPHSPLLQDGAPPAEGEPDVEEPPAWGAPHSSAARYP